MVFEAIGDDKHEEVIFCHNKDVGLKAIIAIHNTVLGPALGGLRMWPYQSEQDAIYDALRLARSMTYKNAVAGLSLGGGQAVIIGDPATDKNEALFRAFGRYVNSLNGRYITGEDVGIDVNDMEYIFRETEYVTGVHQVHGGSGNPSPFTAYGILQGLMATLDYRFGNEDIDQYSFAVQGCGHVGSEFIKLLREQGAKVFVSDINPERLARCVDELGCEALGVDEIHQADVDVFSPCALGGIINPASIDDIKAKVICGSANNQLASADMAKELMTRNITYAPDYAVNAGGVMTVSLEIDGYNRERAMRMMRSIYYNLGRIYKIAEKSGITTAEAADRMAEERIEAIGKIKLADMSARSTRFAGRMRG